MERFFKSLKGEWIGNIIYPNYKVAIIAVFEYIEIFYNTKCVGVYVSSTIRGASKDVNEKDSIIPRFNCPLFLEHYN
ncbi:MAG: IS3 family transposase [Candidatus Hydrogenedentes bacterium]|nr:IS3 family transposase [Candidatus Hydrogenedentota bacterium]